MILCVDPGIRGSGAAMFNPCDPYDGQLMRAAYVKNSATAGQDISEQMEMARCILAWAGMEAGYDVKPTLVVEWMQMYPHQRIINPNTSLLPLIGVVAHLSGAFPWNVRVSYRPHEWKGSIDGDVMTNRILGRLTPEEVNCIEPCPASLRHNAVDAIGLGLHHLGRLARKRVFAR